MAANRELQVHRAWKHALITPLPIADNKVTAATAALNTLRLGRRRLRGQELSLSLAMALFLKKKKEVTGASRRSSPLYRFRSPNLYISPRNLGEEPLFLFEH